MTLQQIMERLLRSRLYRQRVRIETDSGERHEVLVRDLRHEAACSVVVVATDGRPRAEFCIALHRIVAVAGVDRPPPGADRVA